MIVLTSTNNIGGIVDGFMQGSAELARLSEHEREGIERDLRAMEALGITPRRTATAAAASKEHTRKGLANVAAAALRTARTAREPHAAHVATIDADRLSFRAREMATPKGDGSLAELLAEREVRDQLRGKDPLEVFPIYVSALERGDHLTARAIENAPASFPLLSRDHREQGDFLKLQRSPHLDEVMKRDAIAFVYRSVLAAVDEELATVAEDFGVKDDE